MKLYYLILIQLYFNILERDKILKKNHREIYLKNLNYKLNEIEEIIDNINTDILDKTNSIFEVFEIYYNIKKNIDN